MIDALTKRLEMLGANVQQANLNVEKLTKNLAQATTNMNQLHGHYNEVNFLLEEAKKEAALQSQLPLVVPHVETPAAPQEQVLPKENQGAQENGETKLEDAGQAPQE